jgi:hypothetical protein
VSTTFYFEITKNIPFLTRKIQKNKFCASFPLYFLCVFLVSENLVSSYEQLLISRHIGTSTLAVGIVDSYSKVNKIHKVHFWVYMLAILGAFLDCEIRYDFQIMCLHSSTLPCLLSLTLNHSLTPECLSVHGSKFQCYHQHPSFFPSYPSGLPLQAIDLNNLPWKL